MKIYFIGIKGIGVSALAAYLKSRGEEVLGSDVKEKFYSEKILKKHKIKYFEGFDKNNIPEKVDLIISSTAFYDPQNIKPTNPEVLEAINRKIPIKTYPQAISEITKSHYTICISGSHGKSTVTAMTGFILEQAKIDPLVIVGGKLKNWKANILVPKQKKLSDKQIFVLESCEYREAFLKYHPKIAVITNIDFDHPDYFKTPEHYDEAFVKFVKKVPQKGVIIAWGDNPKIKKIASQSLAQQKIFFGFKKENDLQIIDKGVKNNNQFFSLVWKGKNLGEFSLEQPGRPYLLNAACSSAIALYLNTPPKVLENSFKKYKGLSRRFEIISKGDKNSFVVIDDHALSPEQIKSTLEATQLFWPKRKIISIFQPHTFTRTEALMKDFAKSFKHAWEAIILEIYGSAREKTGNVTSFDLINLMKKHHSKVTYLPDISETIKYLKNIKNKKNYIIITLGCENVWRIGKELKKL